MTKPHYSEALLLRLCKETKDILDHEKLIYLYQELEKQGDINFSEKVRNQIKRPKHFFRFISHLNTMASLCEFNLKLQQLQGQGFATITCALVRRLEYQRQLIQQKFLK